MIAVDEARTPDGGREYVRTVACAHCGSDRVVAVRFDAQSLSMTATYECTECSRGTRLIVPLAAGNQVYVKRARG